MDETVEMREESGVATPEARAGLSTPSPSYAPARIALQLFGPGQSHTLPHLIVRLRRHREHQVMRDLLRQRVAFVWPLIEAGTGKRIRRVPMFDATMFVPLGCGVPYLEALCDVERVERASDGMPLLVPGRVIDRIAHHTVDGVVKLLQPAAWMRQLDRGSAPAVDWLFAPMARGCRTSMLLTMCGVSNDVTA